MAKWVPGRHMAVIEGDFVVFLIGARINRKRHLVRALRSIGGMQKMLRWLTEHPEKGLLGFETAGLTIIQYWRSFDDLEHFARDESNPHREVWRRYMQLDSKRGDAGIWHETFRVRAGEYEAIYSNIPRRGLAKAGELVPISGRAETARGRLGAETG